MEVRGNKKGVKNVCDQNVLVMSIRLSKKKGSKIVK